MANAEQKPQEPQTTRKLVIIVVALLAAALLFGVLAYRMATRDDDHDRQQAVSNAECEYVDDEDLCKFFVGWEATGQYTVNATSTQEDQATEYTLVNDENDNFHLTATGDTSYEVIAIGNTIYTRDNDSWSEQTVSDDELNAYRMDNVLEFPEPTSEEATATYAADGTEACDDHTCFKYRVARESDRTMHIWFDDESYHLRRVTITNDNYSYEAVLSFEGVEEITAPPESSPLPEDQYIPPGGAEPEPRPEPDTGNGDAQPDSGNGNGATSNGTTGNGQVQGGNTTLPASGDQIDPEEYREWRKQREAEQQP